MVMPLAGRVVFAVIGGTLVLASVSSVTGTLIVSRSVSSRLTRWVDRIVDGAESHTTYLQLVRFRSPQALSSWVTALLAVLDSAALFLALSPAAAPVIPARLCLRAGFAALTGAVCAAAALVGLGLGLRLLRGRRRLVLFLRRFGFDDATRAVSFAAAGAIGRSWRLVTLDDEKVKAVGGAAGPRRLAGVAALIALVPSAYVVWWMRTHSTDSLLHDVTLSGGQGNSTDIATVVATALVTALVSAAIVALILAFFVLAGIVAGMCSLLLATTYGVARHAERAKKDRIRSQKEVRSRSQAIMRRSGHIFAPRLVVVSVANPVWQQAVHAFAHAAAVAIIDISVPSENLRWEINALLPVMGRRCVLVGRLDLLTTPSWYGHTVFTSPLERDIDGHEVLAYRPDPAGIRHFSRALRATIEARAHGA